MVVISILWPICGKLLSLSPNDPEPYVLWSNIWADDGRWDEEAKIRSHMQKRVLKKVPGQSWIQLKNIIPGLKKDPNALEMRSFLDQLIERLKGIGYLPDANFGMDSHNFIKYASGFWTGK
ncbi:hypothetical protein CDL15_Pgr006100 [Punica granatum]|uniref:Uncharacterized protein n=1 Tax=Punica granatum TaxID=22663 RepID=A0A218VUF0_PUNGR|nr:hypothetical protein CDL15_Pgr006100 [Punica granatum]PKI68092.1 hypothetical protein CRG98_011688 [Punica granatum]